MSDLIVIIVLYNKKISELSIMRDLLKEKGIDIFVYDNSKESQNVPEVKGACLFYVHDKNNAGVSKGYNVGIKKAKALNKKYVLLLDQDSGILATNLEKYLELAEKYGENYLYAPVMCKKNKIYSPAYVNHFIGKVQSLDTFVYTEKYNLNKQSLINSGLMVPIKLIDIIGDFNENIKLDFSDYDFIEKYKKYRQEVILINLYIEHHLSGDEGKNYISEMLRYQYYCNGAKFFNIATHKLRLVPVLRRMFRLIVKYKSLRPVIIFVEYFIGDKKA